MNDDDAATFARVYDPLRRFAVVVGSPGIDPDDLVQEALVRTLRRQPLGELNDPGAYLRTVIVRLASNERRRLGRARRALLRLGAGDEGESSYPSDLADLELLTAPDRAAVYLAVVEQWSHRDIAELLGCSEEASRKRVSRALGQLRTELTQGADDG